MFDPNQMRVGRRLAIKILNASKFALGAAEPTGRLAAAVDRAMLRNLDALVAEATEAFDAYDYARALQRTEAFFWRFCDDYLELVKGRRYGEQGTEGAASANAALTTALSIMLRLFAPFLPFVTEEVWSWWKEGSVHHAAWPTAAEVLAAIGAAGDSAGDDALAVASWALGEIRRTKSEAKKPLRTPVVDFHLTAPAAGLVFTILPNARHCVPVGLSPG